MVNKVSNAEAINIISSSESELRLSKADIAKISDTMGEAEWYAKERIEALNVYNSTPMPTVSDEAWRRTDIRSIDWERFSLGTVEANNGDGTGNVPNLSLIHI